MSKTDLTLFIMIGAFVILAGQFGLTRAFLIITLWKTVPGQIIASSERPTSDVAPGQSKVRYAFTLDGRTYQNSGIRPLRGFIERSETPEYVREHYPLGKAVTVYYDPSNPNTSVLEPFGNPSEFWRMCFPGGHFWYKG